MRKLRKIHINDEVWHWSAEGQRRNVKIYPPNTKTAIVIHLKEYLKSEYPDGFTVRGNFTYYIEEMIEDICYTVTPSGIKRYIKKHIMEL